MSYSDEDLNDHRFKTHDDCVVFVPLANAFYDDFLFLGDSIKK